MKLSQDRQSLKVNESITLTGIPPEAFEYRLGSRSALDWVIDQYQVKGESDPNREDDPGYIVRLAGQVVRVSIATVRITNSLPSYK
jgi:predicted helicase